MNSQSILRRIPARLLTISRCYSKRPVVTIEQIFSPENRARCQEKALSVKPVREVGWMSGREKLAEAAVLVPLCTIGGEPSVILTLRTRTLGSHKGEVSFPGGKIDAGETMVEAALREAEEEIGLDRARLDVWGQMQPVPGKDFKMAITPVIAFCGELDVSELVANAGEVEEIFHRPLTSLVSAENTRYTRWRGRFNYILPVYTGGEHRIWGLSAIILHQALTLLLPGTYNFKIPLVKR